MRLLTCSMSASVNSTFWPVTSIGAASVGVLINKQGSECLVKAVVVAAAAWLVKADAVCSKERTRTEVTRMVRYSIGSFL